MDEFGYDKDYGSFIPGMAIDTMGHYKIIKRRLETWKLIWKR